MRCFTDSSGLRTQGSGIKKAWVFLITEFCVLSSELATACPLCKESLPQGMAKGFFWSILLMLAVPALVVGLIMNVLWRAHLRQRRLSDSPHE